MCGRLGLLGLLGLSRGVLRLVSCCVGLGRAEVMLGGAGTSLVDLANLFQTVGVV